MREYFHKLRKHVAVCEVVLYKHLRSSSIAVL